MAITHNKIIITESGTYTPSVGLVEALVEVLGAGGAGAPVNALGIVSSGAGSGGGAGAYSRILVSSETIGVSQPVVIGEGGSGYTTDEFGIMTGNSGEQSSFGSLCIADGGKGGKGKDVVLFEGGLGGDPSVGVGDVTYGGFQGNIGMSSYYNSSIKTIGGYGASDFRFGDCGGKKSSLASDGSLVGGNATGYVCGGGGACFRVINTPHSETILGGNGGNGVILITEYIEVT